MWLGKVSKNGMIASQHESRLFTQNFCQESAMLKN